jgi:malonyl-CoA/methylmalonyl-CoA synthetase
MRDNLYTLFSSCFPSDRERIFIEACDGRRYSYADLERESARYAAFFAQLGVTPGERVAVQVEKSPQALFLYLACLRAGLIYVPLNPAYRQAEIGYFLEDAAPAAVVCAPELHGMVSATAETRDISRVFTLDSAGGGTLTALAAATPPDFDTVTLASDATAVILYTSGTTGSPKGAMLSHANLAANALALHRAWGFRADDVLLHALPIFHIHGLFVACHCVLLSGGKMIFLRKFDAAEVVRWLPRVTVFMGVPTYYTRLLAQPEFNREVCRRIRLFTCGSAPLLAQTFEEFHERTGHQILERYGMTETGMNTSNPLAGPRRPGTVGPPLPGVEVRIVGEHGAKLADGEVGALEVKGANVFSGYWRKPAKTAEDFTVDGWFKTGDLARRDADGYVAIVGRAKDLIISGGLNIYPKEIEGYINELDGVVESAVIGLPHADFGEAVTAVVVRAPGRDDVTENVILSKLKERIANYKVPKRVFFTGELPRNAMGKVQKNLLRERCASGQPP